MKKLFVKDLKSGDSIFGELFAVKQYKRGSTKNNRPYIDLILGDNSGTLKAKIWADDFAYCETVKEADIISVTGTIGDFQGERQLKITNLSKVENFENADFQPRSELDPEAMFEKIITVKDSIKDKDLQKLFTAFFEDKEAVLKYKATSAAFINHHAYAGGLLEHTTEMIELAKALCKTAPTLNKELLLTGVVFHDIGKIYEFEVTTTVTITTKGKLHGHIFMGAELVKSYGKKYNLSEEVIDELIHMILSHHGKLEFGSPVLPKTPEAIALGMIDDLSAKMNAAFSQIAGVNDSGSCFTEFHRALGTELYISPLTVDKMEGQE